MPHSWQAKSISDDSEGAELGFAESDLRDKEAEVDLRDDEAEVDLLAEREVAFIDDWECERSFDACFLRLSD